MLGTNGLARPLLSVCLALWVLGPMGSEIYADVAIASKGKAVASIVSNGHEEQAQALKKYLSEITGADISVISEAPPEERPVVILEVANSIPGTSDTPKGEQAYHIRTDGHRLYLTGRSEMGLTYAVYGLLEDHLGVRFYSQDCEVVPKNENLTVGEIDDTQEPAFAARRFIYNTEGVDHLIKNRGGGIDGATSTHNFYTYIPPDKYYDEHPEWFGIIDGKLAQILPGRVSIHWMMPLCFTDEELADELANRLMETMAKWDNPDVPIKVGQGDGFQACECEACRKAVADEGSEAGPMILMLNRALEKTTKRFPNHKIVTFAYFGTLKPPRHIRPHPNLWINVASSSLELGPAGDQLGRIRNNPRNKDIAEAIRGWPKIAPGRVTVWEWTVHFFQPLMEWPNILDVADDIRFCAENDITGVNLQILLGNGNWGRLRRWLWLKMMWDTNQDEKKLTQQFLSDYYGPKAAPILWEYLQYVHKVADESGYRASVCRGDASIQNIYKHVFTDDKLERMDELITAAEKAAGEESDPVVAERVAGIRPATIDVLEFHRAGDMAKVKDPRDGSMWLVPGGRTDMPARIDRGAEASEKSGVLGSLWFIRYLFLRNHGGPITGIGNDSLACDVVLNQHARITSLFHKPTGKELVTPGIESLRVFGYEDAVDGTLTFDMSWVPCCAQIWSVTRADEGQLDLAALLHFHSWEGTNMHFQRTMRLDSEAPRLVIDRHYRSMKAGWAAFRRVPDSIRFSSRWRFRLPEPGAATVSITRGGVSESLPIRGGEKSAFEVAEPGGDLVVRLDRGDGLIVQLSAQAEGFDWLEVEPDAAESALTVLLRGIPQPMDREEAEIDLPAVVLEVEVRQQ